MANAAILNELVPFEEDRIWTCAIPLRFLWLPIGARMTVIKLENQELLIHSPVSLNSKIKKQLRKIGKVKHVVSPNCLHHLFIGDYLQEYPSATFYASPGLPGKRKDLVFRRLLKDAPEVAWCQHLDQIMIAGVESLREIVFFHKAAKTLIVADLIMNFGESSSVGLKCLLKMFGVYGRPFSTIDKNKLSEIEKRLLKRSIKRILQWDFDKIILSHGEVITSNGKPLLQDVFSWLLQES